MPRYGEAWPFLISGDSPMLQQKVAGKWLSGQQTAWGQTLFLVSLPIRRVVRSMSFANRAELRSCASTRRDRFGTLSARMAPAQPRGHRPRDVRIMAARERREGQPVISGHHGTDSPRIDDSSAFDWARPTKGGVGNHFAMTGFAAATR